MRALTITNTITRRDEKSIEKYLTEIGKYDVLTPEEELDLFQRGKMGDQEAFDLIVLHNLRFVVSVAKQYQNLGFKLGDLINEGNLGLLKAVKRFDETKGFKFISYAVWWIRQSIIQAINDKGKSIRIPSNVGSNNSKLLSTMTEFLQKNERNATIDELAEITGWTPEVVQRSMDALKRPKSLDAPVNDDSDMGLIGLLEDTASPEPDFALNTVESQQLEVEQLLNTLTKRQSEVIRLHFGIGITNSMTLSDIGDNLGITRERTRQIKDRALHKLRRQVKAKQLTFSLS
ncbi:MAG: RNA polymerase sigma factor RpoD/SigA [Bacteroidota bacterium]